MCSGVFLYLAQSASNPLSNENTSVAQRKKERENTYSSTAGSLDMGGAEEIRRQRSSVLIHGAPSKRTQLPLRVMPPAVSTSV